MTLSKCGRFWYAIDHNPIDDWYVEFVPAQRGDIKRIRRGGFATADQAMRAVVVLAEEWCVTSDVDCGGGA